MNYSDYLQLPACLLFKVRALNPAEHDEMLFIVIHQTTSCGSADASGAGEDSRRFFRRAICTRRSPGFQRARTS